jgi:glucosamine 6-phosphate synthetase-like amidotransferase/phosphosugar isomerase protein
VVVYEPFNDNEKPTIKSVTKLEQNGIYKGLKIESIVDSEIITQLVLTQSENQVFENKKLDIYFKGTFAVITLNSNNKLKSIYIGEGEALVFKNEKVVIPADTKTFFKAY